MSSSACTVPPIPWIVVLHCHSLDYHACLDNTIASPLQNEWGHYVATPHNTKSKASVTGCEERLNLKFENHAVPWESCGTINRKDLILYIPTHDYQHEAIRMTSINNTLPKINLMWGKLNVKNLLETTNIMAQHDATCIYEHSYSIFTQMRKTLKKPKILQIFSHANYQ